MSKRFGSVGQQYLDSNGDPLSGGKLNFYQPGTVTRKDTYTTSAESVANANPVVLDAAGRQGDIWFTGEAKVVLTDSADVEIDTTDPVGEDAAGSPFSDYNSTTSYSQGEIVVASNGRYYRSIVNSNVGNEPSASASQWEEFRFLGVYNSAQTYLQDDVVEDGAQLYLSLQGSNTGNTPASTPAYWRPISAEVWLDTTPKTTAFTAVAGRSYLIDSSTPFTMTMPASPTAGDKVGVTDYAEQWDSNELTVGRNGSEIMNLAEDMTMDVKNFSGVFSYTTDRGWVLTS